MTHTYVPKLSTRNVPLLLSILLFTNELRWQHAGLTALSDNMAERADTQFIFDIICFFKKSEEPSLLLLPLSFLPVLVRGYQASDTHWRNYSNNSCNHSPMHPSWIFFRSWGIIWNWQTNVQTNNLFDCKKIYWYECVNKRLTKH